MILRWKNKILRTGPTIHVILRLAASDYNLGTLTFVRIYGTIPPVISILTSSMKFAICEPRPNLLSRCLFNKSDVITGMNISGMIMYILYPFVIITHVIYAIFVFGFGSFVQIWCRLSEMSDLALLDL